MYAFLVEKEQEMQMALAQENLEDDLEEESTEDRRSHVGTGPGFFQQSLRDLFSPEPNENTSSLQG